MLKKLFLLLIFLILLFSLAACNQPCTKADLVAPVLTSPANYANVGIGPTQGQTMPDEFFQWSFGPNCSDVTFRIQYAHNPDFYPLVGFGPPQEKKAAPTSPFSFPALLPAEEYYVRVQAYVDGTYGPWSGTHVFFTGPECSSVSELEPPTIVNTLLGGLSNDPIVDLEYKPGPSDCIPDGYFVDLQKDPNFAGNSIIGEINHPTTYITTPELDCGHYFWRVAAIYNGERGSFSETESFNIWNPECPEISVSQASLEIFETSQLSFLCEPEELTPPALFWPPQAAEVGEPGPTLDPGFFEWGMIDCIPELFKVRFTTDPNWGIYRVGFAEWMTSWPPQDAEYPEMGLEPASEYFWEVAAWSDGVNGPASVRRTFFTGPSCANPGDLSAPELLSPSDGAVIPALALTLRYEPGEDGCIPDGYYIDLQTAEDFSGTSLYDQEWSSKHTFFNISGLSDCTTYFVRVAQIEDQTFGPFSESHSFFTNESGFCAQSLTPEFKAVSDLRCYQGPVPGTYPILGYLLEGEAAAIVAQSLDQAWWYIQNPDGPDICAVRKDGGESGGETGDIPLWNNPDTEPEDEGPSGGSQCNASLDERQCLAVGGTGVYDRAGNYISCQCP
jgi:hypothetical protein